MSGRRRIVHGNPALEAMQPSGAMCASSGGLHGTKEEQGKGGEIVAFADRNTQLDAFIFVPREIPRD